MKKAQLSGVPNTILTFVVLIVVIAIGSVVVSQIRDNEISYVDQCNATSRVGCSASYNASAKGLEGMTKWSTFAPTIAIVLVSALLIAIVVGAFIYMRR